MPEVPKRGPLGGFLRKNEVPKGLHQQNPLAYQDQHLQGHPLLAEGLLSSHPQNVHPGKNASPSTPPTNAAGQNSKGHTPDPTGHQPTSSRPNAAIPSSKPQAYDSAASPPKAYPIERVPRPPVQGPGNYTAAKKQHFANAFEPSPFAHKEQNNPPGLSKRSGTDVLQGIANGVQAITGSIPILKSPAKKLWARLLKDKSFNVGDMVKLRQNTGGVNGQFGPFKISACHENNKYDIKRMDESIARENVSGNDLERW